MQNSKQIQLTLEGYKFYTAEIKKLENEIKRLDREITKVLEITDMQDSQYQDLIELKGDAMDRLAEIREIVGHSEILENEHVPRDHVTIGSTVKLVNHKVCHHVMIVTSYEASPLEGRISEDSPIGSKVMGRKLGEEVMITSPQGDVPFVITEIE